MELPAYRVPSVKNVARRLWDRAKDFIVRAGTIIFAMSVVVWFLQSFSPSLQMVTDPAQSMFGRLGAFIAPIFAPLGFGDGKRASRCSPVWWPRKRWFPPCRCFTPPVPRRSLARCW